MRLIRPFEKTLTKTLFKIKDGQLHFSSLLPALITRSNCELKEAYFISIDQAPGALKKFFDDAATRDLFQMLQSFRIEDLINRPNFEETFPAEVCEIIQEETYHYLIPAYGANDELTVEQAERKGRTQAILMLMFKNYRESDKLTIMFDHLNENNYDLEIPISTKEALRKYLERKEAKGFPDALIHGHMGNPSNNKELTRLMKDILILLATNLPTKRTANSIKLDLDYILEEYPKAKKNGIYSVSESRIFKYLNSPEGNNAISYAKDNPTEFRRNVSGLLRFLRASAPLIKVYIDGYLFQVQYFDEQTRKPEGLVGIFVSDDCSSATLGLSIDDSENGRSVAEALQDFFKNTSRKVPKEIVMDKFTFKMIKPNKHLLEVVRRYGAKITVSSTANRKAKIENHFLRYQEKVESNALIQHIGPGVKAKGKNAHPFKSFKVLLSKKEALEDKHALIRQLTHLVKVTFNNISKGLEPSAMEIMETVESKPAGEIPEDLMPKAFYEHHQVTFRSGAVILIREELTHIYYKRDFETLQEYNGVELDAFVKASDTSVVYLYNVDSIKLVMSIGEYEVIPTSVFERENWHEAYVKNFNKQTNSILKSFDVFFARARQNVNQATEDKEVYKKLTTMAKIKKEMAERDIPLEIGLNQNKEVNMFHANKSRRKGRRASNEIDLGLDIVSTF